jgi:hypothetical protein
MRRRDGKGEEEERIGRFERRDGEEGRRRRRDGKTEEEAGVVIETGLEREEERDGWEGEEKEGIKRCGSGTRDRVRKGVGEVRMGRGRRGRNRKWWEERQC